MPSLLALTRIDYDVALTSLPASQVEWSRVVVVRASEPERELEAYSGGDLLYDMEVNLHFVLEADMLAYQKLRALYCTICEAKGKGVKK